MLRVGPCDRDCDRRGRHGGSLDMGGEASVMFAPTLARPASLTRLGRLGGRLETLDSDSAPRLTPSHASPTMLRRLSVSAANFGNIAHLRRSFSLRHPLPALAHVPASALSDAALTQAKSHSAPPLRKKAFLPSSSPPSLRALRRGAPSASPSASPPGHRQIRIDPQGALPCRPSNSGCRRFTT